MITATSKRSRQGSAIKLLARSFGYAPPSLDHCFKDCLSAALELVEMIAIWQDSAWKDLFADQVPNPHAVGMEALPIYEEAIRGLETAYATLSSKQADVSPEALAELATGINRVRSLHADFKKRWPMFDLAELDAANERIKQGQFITGEDLFRELLGTD